MMKEFANYVTAALIVLMGLVPITSGQDATDDALDVNGTVSTRALPHCIVPYCEPCTSFAFVWYLLPCIFLPCTFLPCTIFVPQYIVLYSRYLSCSFWTLLYPLPCYHNPGIPYDVVLVRLHIQAFLVL